MDQSGHVFEYQASMVPGQEPPTYAWAAERLAAGVERLQEAFRMVGQIQDRAAGLSVTVTAVANPATGQLAPEFTFPPISEQAERVRLGILASEVLHHVRSSLEYFAFVSAWKQHNEPKTGTAFPICDSSQEWAQKGTQRRLGLLTPDAASAIEQIQPFNGVDWSGKLRDLSNRDKHRHAIVLSPTLKWQCPHDYAGLINQPLSTQATVNLLVAGADEAVRFQDLAKDIVDGVAKFLSPFLLADGHSELHMTWTYWPTDLRTRARPSGRRLEGHSGAIPTPARARSRAVMPRCARQ